MYGRSTILAFLLAWTLITHSGAVAQAAPKPSDDTITYWVREALVDDPRIDASTITVRTQDGIVTLTGSLQNLTAKKFADLQAKKIRGVRGVVNELQITPSFRYDADITQDIRQRFITHASINSFALRVTTNDGVVTIAGPVDSWSQSQEAALLASEVRGVKAVTNHIMINYLKSRSDIEIQRDITTSLARDVYLTGLSIGATVKDGRVTLQGEVGTAYQKDRANDDVLWLSNVAGVDNRLKVIWWEDMGTRQRSPLPSNEQLSVAVRDELIADPRLDASEVTVYAREGDVTLSGTVPAYYQKRLAAQDVNDVVGVLWVTNRLVVRTLQRNDADLQRDVQLQLDSDALLTPGTVVASVHDGAVTLTGNVNSAFMQTHAADVASHSQGVRNIVDNITVHWSDWYTDAAITQRIKDFLAVNAETQWVAEHIQVAVNRGVVTLTGRVTFWAERDEASEIARQTTGVHQVNNQLIVANLEG